MPNPNDYAKNAVRFGGIKFSPKGNDSKNATGLRKTYLVRETQAYAQEVGEIADNCYDAEMQGVNPDKDWYEFTPVMIRTAPASVSSTGTNDPDDWQKVRILKPTGYTYVSPGAYVKYGGSTWIAAKSYNFGSGMAQFVARRCNAVINTLDWYGNIKAVPISYAKTPTQSNAPQVTENSITSKNYVDCICQKNADSAGFEENTRVILGRTAYAIRGINDFTREFTDDAESVHLTTFTLSRVETLKTDNLDLQCADYYGFTWKINIVAHGSMGKGSKQRITVTDERNGAAVAYTDEHPISHSFESSDITVLRIDQTGEMTAVGNGTATITVTLDQNPNIKQTFEVEVAESGAAFVDFTVFPMNATLKEFTSALITAAYYENGAATTDEVTFAFSGAPTISYIAEETENANSVLLTCFAASPVPLTITASCKDVSISKEIILTAG